MNSEYFDDNDISWLTQEPSVDAQKANFDICGYGDDEGESVEWFSSVGDANVVSFEEDCGRNAMVKGTVLYNGVIAEDISSDEEIDKM